MYHIGVAWRGEVRKVGQVRMIHHLLEPWLVKVCTQLGPPVREPCIFERRVSTALGRTGTMARASMASMAQVQRDLVGGIDLGTVSWWSALSASDMTVGP